MIVGAGLAGLIAAHALPRHQILEARSAPAANHRALLRFRSAAVGELTGVEFRPVTVRKGIWIDGRWTTPNIRVANLYSLKVVGRFIDRSIWDVDPVVRWIAPETFYEELVEAAGPRISWGVGFEFTAAGEPIISTAPLPGTLERCGIAHNQHFYRAPITVQRFRVMASDVYQTVYYPTPDHSLYRASITGDLLICEFAGDPEGDWLDDVAESMALRGLKPLEEVSQDYGKIAPIDEGARRALVARLTQDHNVFSLGRFATWRNILLDDVVHDIAIVKRLMNATHYERRLAAL